MTEAAKDLVEGLGEALDRYGRHDGLCGIIGGYGYCTCGLTDAKGAFARHRAASQPSMSNEEVREQIARIIVPFAGWGRPEQAWMSSLRDEALAKADAIVATAIRNMPLSTLSERADDRGGVK